MRKNRKKQFRYKVTICKEKQPRMLCELHPEIRKFFTADEIVDALGCGLSKDIIYRKVKISSKRGHAYTGHYSTPHSHILVERITA